MVQGLAGVLDAFMRDLGDLRRPGLGTGADDDLQVTTDYRNVFGEIVARRFPDRSLAEVFPGLSYSPVGLMS